MMRTRSSLIVRRAAGAFVVLLVVAACTSKSNDAARTDSAAGTAGEMQAGPSVPAPGPTIVDSAKAAPAAPAADSTASAAAAPASGAMLDPNSATKEQLTAVPGMTAAAADALIAGRPYKDMVAANAALAKSLNADARKTVYAKVWKPIDLNTASGEEILLIPGVGPRMRHEFEEYRPYKNIETFRREIGKYVDKAEVARLEQYVTIR